MRIDAVVETGHEERLPAAAVTLLVIVIEHTFVVHQRREKCVGSVRERNRTDHPPPSPSKSHGTPDLA